MMSTNKVKIIELIEGKPGILAPDLATALGIDVSDVYGEIREETKSGRFLAEKVDSPTYGRVTSYRPNPTFLGWKTPAKGNASTDSGAEAGTKAEKAIAFLRSNKGVATMQEMHEAMGLEEKQYPIWYLETAIKKGYIERDGKGWRLGNVTAAKKSAPARPPVIEGNAKLAESKPAKHPAVPKTTREKPASPALPLVANGKATQRQKPAHIPQDSVVSSMSVAGLQIILWGRGALVVSANDNTVELAPDQAKALRAFVELT